MNLFFVKLVLSFLVGGSYIALTIWASERFGSKIGGVLVGLPSTLLVSLIFIAWTQNTGAALNAIPVVPAAIAANSLFLVAFITLYKHGKVIALAGALLCWLLLTLPLVLTRINNIGLSLFLAAVFFSPAVLYFRRFDHQRLMFFKSTGNIFIFRACYAGSFVALAVLLGRFWGPLWGGLFSSFPAAFSSALLLIERAHGIEFASSVAKSMPYGSMGNIIFIIVFYFLTPHVGLVYGLIVGYAGSIVFILAVNRFLLGTRLQAMR